VAHRRIRSGLNRRPREFVIGERRVVAEGLTETPWADLYRTAMAATWPQFLGALAAMFVALNAVFAWAYGLGGDTIANARKGSFADLFFFSVETLSTTGFGDMHPQTTYAHLVATLEIFVSLVATAGITGLIFARFSRPRARLIFASNPVVVKHDGVETLMVRVVNARKSYITEATAKLWTLAPSVTAEGRRFRGFRPMRLLRGENPAFALSWTLFHPIDADSPLYNKSREDAIADKITFVLSITGVDEISSQTVYTRQVYAADDLRWGHEFVDMFHIDDNNRSHVNFSKVNDTREVRT
jgi:inward rectifier potassium channel